MHLIGSFGFFVAALAVAHGLPGGPPVMMQAQYEAVCYNLRPAASAPHMAQMGTNGYVVDTTLPLDTAANMYRYTAGAQYVG